MLNRFMSWDISKKRNKIDMKTNIKFQLIPYKYRTRYISKKINEGDNMFFTLPFPNINEKTIKFISSNKI